MFRFYWFFEFLSINCGFENQACVELGDNWVITTLWTSCPVRQSQSKYSLMTSNIHFDGIPRTKSSPSQDVPNSWNAPDMDRWPILTIIFSFPLIEVQTIYYLFEQIDFHKYPSLTLSVSLSNFWKMRGWKKAKFRFNSISRMNCHLNAPINNKKVDQNRVYEVRKFYE